MDNPYASPPPGNTPFGDQFNQPLPFQPSPGLVGQVRVVGILMTIQGVCAVLMGLVLLAYGLFFPVMMRQMAAQDPNFRGPKEAEMAQVMPIMIGVMCGMAALALVPGILLIVAGIRTYQFRSRGLAIGSLIAGLIPVITCYCAPTAIAMAAYGLIVLFNAQVISAFEMKKRGMDGEQILASFYQGKVI